MSVKDILHEIVDKIPFSENDRNAIKADIDNLDAPAESSQTTETTTSGTDQGNAATTESPVAGTVSPPAPETTPATEVGMGIVPEPVANTEADNTPAAEPAPAPAAVNPTMGIVTDSAPEVESPAEDATETTSENEVASTPPPAPSPESGSGSGAS